MIFSWREPYIYIREPTIGVERKSQKIGEKHGDPFDCVKVNVVVFLNIANWLLKLAFARVKRGEDLSYNLWPRKSTDQK